MTLQEWFIQLSATLDGELTEASSVEEGLEWFGDLPEPVLNKLSRLASKDSSLRDFLAVGAHLLEEYENDYQDL